MGRPTWRKWFLFFVAASAAILQTIGGGGACAFDSAPGRVAGGLGVVDWWSLGGRIRSQSAGLSATANFWAPGRPREPRIVPTGPRSLPVPALIPFVSLQEGGQGDKGENGGGRGEKAPLRPSAASLRSMKLCGLLITDGSRHRRLSRPFRALTPRKSTTPDSAGTRPF